MSRGSRFSLEDEKAIDAVCLRYESALREQATRPQREDFLKDVEVRLRDRLERELLALEDELRGDGPAPHGMPTRFGPYRVVRALGEGGMGVVYEAIQDVPRRRVAVKVIRADVSSEETRQRFEREIRLLGHLHHPGIAQIFDAGIDEQDGIPVRYLVMELVRGRPLLTYARENALDTERRLELIRRVCLAVQHAHDQGVIHRDLKSPNILVAESDSSSDTATSRVSGVGQPKVLDFGVARALEGDDDSTLATAAGKIVGTLSHMSPEQVSGNAEPVDERTDIYSLGVVLHELLVGRPPLDLSGLTIPAAIDRIRGATPPSVGLVDRRYRGDVDVIVRKALQPEPDDRYASAFELAADIQRHLDDEPIRARGPDAADRIRKFARRNRGLVAGLVVAMAVLVLAVVLVSGYAIRETELRGQSDDARRDAQRALARAEAVSDFLISMLSRANANRGGNPKETLLVEALNAAALEVGDAFPDQPGVEAAVRHVIGQVYMSLTEHQKAVEHLRPAERLLAGIHGEAHVDVAEVRCSLGRALEVVGELDEAEGLLRSSLALLRKHPERGASIGGALNDLAALLEVRGQFDEASKLHREALALRERLLGPDAIEVAASLNNLATLLQAHGDAVEAEAMFRRALDIRRRKLEAPHRLLAHSLNNLGGLLYGKGEMDAAAELFEEALAMRRRLFGDDHLDVAEVCGNLGAIALRRGDHAKAAEMMQRTIDAHIARLGEDHVDVANWRINLSVAKSKMGQFEEARKLVEAGHACYAAAYGDRHPKTAWSLQMLADSVRETGDLERAVEFQGQALECHREVLGHSRETAECLYLTARTYEQFGRKADALALTREAVEMFHATLGDRSSKTIRAEVALVRRLAAAGENAAARKLALEVRKRCESIPPAAGVIRGLDEMLKNIPEE